ncbi:beta-glucosidase 12-like [Coffea eugenioides]|uniref:beta-glucosidase 12-like n=1 Tax=Coffea eugenioides TaxID=49369 RepID=UPI000F604585|nr:beta-glucosidase 12-like [Coffea eugenioides]
MEFLTRLILLCLLFLAKVNATDYSSEPFSPIYQIGKFNRSSFPTGFLFGASSSAYQIEGAWNLDGKGPSIWDTFTHKFPEKIKDHNNGDVATDSYHLYKEDVRVLKEMSMDSYRFSISWSRILPRGRLSGGVNEKGIQYYNNLIDYLLMNGILPTATLFHWDLPQALEDEYSGFLSPLIVNDFHDFANLCFERFGDRVKQWITFNEPAYFSQFGYDMGIHAPGRCSSWMNNNCTGGDSSTEPYIVSHHQLLAHAAAVKLYKTKYQEYQKGKIGITHVALWTVPHSHSLDDRRASIRSLDFSLGWFMDPLVFGDYPSSMRTLVGDRLPQFTKEQSELVKGSYDFIGLNYYTSFYVVDAGVSINIRNKSYSTDSRSSISVERSGKLIGEHIGSNWIYYYPRGLWKMLLYVKKKYQNPIIYITENGVDDSNNSTMLLKALNDHFRIKYYHGHLSFLHKAIRDGVQVKGFYGWSIVDNFEWASGFTVRFGLNYVDFENGLKRIPKLSAKWFKGFLEKY